MKKQFSKKIEPQIFHAKQLQDLNKYRVAIADRAKKYANFATIQVNNCYICKGRNFDPLVTIYNYDYVRCQDCTHVMLKRRLSKKHIIPFYRESIQFASTYTDKDLITYRLKNIAKPKVDFVMKTIGNKGKGSWLDIGCAIGDIVKVVEDNYGWKGIGLDISENSVKLGKEVFNVDLRLTQFSEFIVNNNEKFDVISAFGYLCLVPEFVEELKTARQWIKSGGYLVIGESNAESFTTLVQQTHPEFTIRHLLPPTIVHEFTPKSLFRLLEDLRFKPLAIWDFGLDFAEWLKYFCLLDKKFQDSPLYRFLLNNCNTFQGVIDKKTMGDYMIVVAKKQ